MTKKIHILIRDIIFLALPLVAVGGSMLSSCSDFLQEEDKDKVIPRTMEQYEAMLHQEGFLDVSWFYRSDLMTDDVSENTKIITTAKNRVKRLYTWQSDVEYTGDGTFNAENNVMWEKLYNDILVANYIIELSDNIVDGDATPSKKNNLKAEAYFLRARAYLELVNIYAEPYDAATAANTPGVPLREGTGIVNDYRRSSVAQVYGQIESDLMKAIELFNNSSEKKSLWHPNKKASLLLLSRVYLYKGEWQNVINTTNELISLCPLGLYAMNIPGNDRSAVVRAANYEVLHTYGMIAGTLVDNASEGVPSELPIIYRVEGSMSLPSYGVSKELLDLFVTDDTRNDCRRYLYFKQPSSNETMVTGKWHSQFTELGGYSYRLSEAYLSRAEAYAALGNTNMAVKDIIALLSKRIDGEYMSLLPDPEEYQDESSYQLAVRKFVLDQRRLELCFENHRWYDIRRTSTWYPKSIIHRFTQSVAQSGFEGTPTSTEEYTLPAGSPNYTFELPKSETDINSTIKIYGKRENIQGRIIND